MYIYNRWSGLRICKPSYKPCFHITLQWYLMARILCCGRSILMQAVVRHMPCSPNIHNRRKGIGNSMQDHARFYLSFDPQYTTVFSEDTITKPSDRLISLTLCFHCCVNLLISVCKYRTQRTYGNLCITCFACKHSRLDKYVFHSGNRVNNFKPLLTKWEAMIYL